jgi:hypothetical protein
MFLGFFVFGLKEHSPWDFAQFRRNPEKPVHFGQRFGQHFLGNETQIGADICG